MGVFLRALASPLVICHQGPNGKAAPLSTLPGVHICCWGPENGVQSRSLSPSLGHSRSVSGPPLTLLQPFPMAVPFVRHLLLPGSQFVQLCLDLGVVGE